ncbi:MAG TPA: prephenate dehydratase domain-containing protein [Candidatus Saccharibacteria bacterium]|nr:prephenate dehydratase domain-containing protein [Candidatus Saccharibacteria bacterium]
MKKIKVAIQGQKNSYHDEALIKLNNKADFTNCKLVPIYCYSFEEAFNKVKTKEADYALLAIENGVHGHIYETLDIILKNKAQILTEIYLPIHHQLASLTNDLTSITDIYSHFAAFTQCDKFLESELPKTKHHVFEDTAAAAIMIKREGDKSKAAICSASAALENGLNIIAPNIENFNDNVTRFFLLLDNATRPSINFKNQDKTSLVLTTSHTPGALFRALESFYRNDLNLSALTSRPGDGGSINYKFYIEIESSQYNSNFKNAIKGIETGNLGEIDILGTY